MKRLKGLLHGPSEDRGATLILVLFIVTLMGLAGAALLTFSDTSIRTTIALRDQDGTTYSADGAGQAAISSLRTGYGFDNDLFDNATNTKCFGSYGDTLNLPDFYPATNSHTGTAASSASVVCSADPDTGANGTVVPINTANRPAGAVLTTGRTTGENGINVKALGTPAIFDVRGNVKANSNINVVTGGTLSSTAAVTAYGTCAGTIVSVPTKSCSLAANAVSDPGYASDATAVPAYQDVPLDDKETSCPNGVVTFLPGYYDDAIALSSLMTGSGPCSGSTWWFKPGTYYFDFHNNTKDAADVYRGSGTGTDSTANRWAITTGHLVAGTPVNGDGHVIASPGDSPAIPGSCQSPIKSVNAKGVQFIFGGESQLALGGPADAEICGTYSATKPPIGVYGVKDLTATATTTILTGTGTTATSSLKMSTVDSPGLFTNPTRVIQQDASSATWVKGATPPSETSTIAVSGYSPPSDIPAGSIVKSATIRVQHGNSAKYKATDKLTLTFTPNGMTGSPVGPAITPPFALAYTSTGLVTASLPIQTLNATSSTFSQYVHENGFTGADMVLTAALTHAGTQSLDAIQIDITYVRPQFRNQSISTITSNCIKVKYPTTGTSGSCALLSTSVAALPAFTGAFYIQGMTYAPLAVIDLTLSKATQQVLRFGDISRSLWITKTGPFSYPGPVIDVPDITEGHNTAPVVFLTVFLCPDTNTPACSTDPKRIKALRAKALIDDSDPPRKITILSWSKLR